MKEEKVTINILNWLEENSWKIICYDFPQSGTGMLLHPDSDNTRASKNRGGIIPDILATRNYNALFFENKDRFVLSDFEKLRSIKYSGSYSNALNNILRDDSVKEIFYGIGIPAIEKHVKKSLENINGIDFLISVNLNGSVNVSHDEKGIFL